MPACSPTPCPAPPTPCPVPPFFPARVIPVPTKLDWHTGGSPPALPDWPYSTLDSNYKTADATHSKAQLALPAIYTSLAISCSIMGTFPELPMLKCSNVRKVTQVQCYQFLNFYLLQSMKSDSWNHILSWGVVSLIHPHCLITMAVVQVLHKRRVSVNVLSVAFLWVGAGPLICKSCNLGSLLAETAQTQHYNSQKRNNLFPIYVSRLHPFG